MDDQKNLKNSKIVNIFRDAFNSKFRWIIIILSGSLIGLLFTNIYISRAFSYLSDDPKVCINCHIMFPQYATWNHSSHRERATCNDCHVPHENIFKKYLFKAQDGMRHATMFTLRLEPQVIHIKDAGKGVVQQNCIRCHSKTVDGVSPVYVTASNAKHGEGLLCWQCHREVPHGRVRSESATPNAIVPGLSPVIPDWISNKK